MAATNSIGNLSLSTKQGCLLNCLGIQPIFVEDNTIKSSYLGFVYRTTSLQDKHGTMKYMFKYYNDNDTPLKNCFHYNESQKTVVNFLLNNSFTLKVNSRLDDLMKNKPLLKETIWFYMQRIHYYTTACKGNFLITSRKDLYSTLSFLGSEIQNYTPYLVSESLLPRNIVIIGHKNLNAFCNPFIAAPIIDKKHFTQICRLNNIDVKDFGTNPSKHYPLIEKHLNLYSLYQSYLDNVDVPYWYIEKFHDKPKTRQIAYYTTLYFD